MTAIPMTVSPMTVSPTTSPALVMLHRASGGSPSPSIAGATLGPADPFSAGRREVAWMIPAAAAGRAGFDGAVDGESFPHTETMIVLSGALRLS